MRSPEIGEAIELSRGPEKGLKGEVIEIHDDYITVKWNDGTVKRILKHELERE